MWWPHERQSCHLPPTLLTASPDDLWMTHSKWEEDHGTRVGKAKGRRRASWPRGCQALPPLNWRSALGLCGTHCWGQHYTDDYNFPEVCSSIPARRQGPSSVVQEHWRWHLYPRLGWWPVSGVKRVASCCEGGACQRACLWPATADHPAHKTQSSHGQEAGILTCKPEKENQNKMRTLRSVFFSNTEMYDKGGKSYLSTRFLVARNCRPLKSIVTQAGFHPKSV